MHCKYYNALYIYNALNTIYIFNALKCITYL
nr:MAG TPA: hypothetical protein [Caudoviricetes sp.]